MDTYDTTCTLGHQPSVPSTVAPNSTDIKPKTLSEALAQAETKALLPEQALHQIGADLKAIARATGKSLEELPAAPSELRPILNRVLPKATRLSNKRWMNILSSLRRLLRAVGLHACHDRSELPPGTPWALLVGRIACPPRRAVFTGFARWCLAQGITPAEVKSDTIVAFVEWRTTTTFAAYPAQLRAGLRSTWNRLAKDDPGLRKLPPVPRPDVEALPLAAFPASFQADLKAYLDQRLHADPFDDVPQRSVRAITANFDRQMLVRAASLIARESGIESIHSIGDLVQPERVKKVLLQFYRRSGGRWGKQASDMIQKLILAARIHVRVDEECMKQLEWLRRPIVAALAEQSRARQGLSTRSRERMGQFDDQRTIARLFRLPQQQYTVALAMEEQRPVRAARVHERALALDLLLHHPIRRANLLNLRLDLHFRRNDHGRITKLFIPAEEMKNGCDFHGVIPPELAARIDRHIKRFRPKLPGSGGPFLFPVKDGTRPAQNLGTGISDLVADELGLRFNPHLIRHLAACLILDADPHNAVVAQRVLGHSTLRMTEHLYGALRNRSALSQWHDMVSRTRQQATR
jgi:integrase